MIKIKEFKECTKIDIDELEKIIKNSEVLDRHIAVDNIKGVISVNNFNLTVLWSYYNKYGYFNTDDQHIILSKIFSKKDPNLLKDTNEIIAANESIISAIDYFFSIYYKELVNIPVEFDFSVELIVLIASEIYKKLAPGLGASILPKVDKMIERNLINFCKENTLNLKTNDILSVEKRSPLYTVFIKLEELTKKYFNTIPAFLSDIRKKQRQKQKKKTLR